MCILVFDDLEGSESSTIVYVIVGVVICLLIIVIVAVVCFVRYWQRCCDHRVQKDDFKTKNQDTNCYELPIATQTSQYFNNV